MSASDFFWRVCEVNLSGFEVETRPNIGSKVDGVARRLIVFSGTLPREVERREPLLLPL